MININNKTWDRLRSTDIVRFLNSDLEESFYFEFKTDDESTDKFIKEVDALSNTYGGYILLGINDDKTVSGCKKWTEQRIHASIHDSITPTPIFDVKKFTVYGEKVLVVRIEEGPFPPYVTNKGRIFERVSSGSFPIKESSKLALLYEKRSDQLIKIKNKIELSDIKNDNFFPQNIFGYLDIGFSLVCAEPTFIQKRFSKPKLDKILEPIKMSGVEYSLSRVGMGYVFSIGRIEAKDNNGNTVPVPAGTNNFMEILGDGSAKIRILFYGKQNDDRVSIVQILTIIEQSFKNIYTNFLGNDLAKHFIHAHKYEKLTVLKQFVPVYSIGSDQGFEDRFAKYLERHKNKYGNNIIIEGSRFPRNDYLVIDRAFFDQNRIKYNSDNLYNELFSTVFFNLGYIDLMEERTE